MDHQVKNERPLSAAIGYFDGLHKGHQKLIHKVLEISQEENLVPTMITFDPDPVVVVRKLDSIHHIMTLEDKINVAKSMGIEVVIILEIDERMMKLEPEVFIQKFLVDMNIKSVVCGFDFRFGYKGSGSAQTLLEHQHLFKVDVIDEVDYNDEKISSTRIISTLKEGKVDEVMTLLGRPYTISGIIVAGNQKGRKIGFPTANLKVDPEYHDVKEGVYITQVYVNQKWYHAMTNVGHNLTFNTSDPISIETYILDFNERIYGQQIRLAFYKYLRPELKFDTVEKLVDQMKDDESATIYYFDQRQQTLLDEKSSQIVYDITE